MTAIKIKDLGKKVMDDYNAAMAKKEWVGLTNEERLKIVRGFHATEYALATAVEAKLKEKNDL